MKTNHSVNPRRAVSLALVCALLFSVSVPSFATQSKTEDRLSRLDTGCPELFDVPWDSDSEEFLLYLILDCYEQFEEADTELEVFDRKSDFAEECYLLDGLPDLLDMDTCSAEVEFNEGKVYTLRIYYMEDLETVIRTYEKAYGTSFTQASDVTSASLIPPKNGCYVTVREAPYDQTVVSYYL